MWNSWQDTITPLDRRLFDHALTSSLSRQFITLGVEANDPYITIQVNSIHTIPHCRMDDSVLINQKMNASIPQSQYLDKPPSFLTGHKDLITGTLKFLTQNSFIFKYTYEQ